MSHTGEFWALSSSCCCLIFLICWVFLKFYKSKNLNLIIIYF
jgi:hypothetical protein